MILPLLNSARAAFRMYIAEGCHHFQLSEPSHLAFRTATVEDYEKFKIQAQEIGRIYEHTHNGRPLTWVYLSDPLIAPEGRIDWLEILSPKEGETLPTGPKALVFSYSDCDKALITTSQQNEHFSFRRQPKSAWQLTGPQL